MRIVTVVCAAYFAACGSQPRPDAGADAAADTNLAGDTGGPFDARDEGAVRDESVALDAAADEAPDEAPDHDASDEAAGPDGAPDSELPPIPGCAVMVEQCNGRDDDCDGLVDETCRCEPGSTQRCYGGDPRRAGVGVCTYGTQGCTGGGFWGTCTGWGEPRAQTCTGIDERCSGVINEGCSCRDEFTRACYAGPEGTAGVGTCRAGIERYCALPGGVPQRGACEGQVLPEPTRCDGVDRACTGTPFAGCACTPGERRGCYTGPEATRGVGECRDGEQQCALDASGVAAWSRCVGEVTPSVGYDVRCDGRDHLCRGVAPASCRCLLGQSRSCYSGPEGTAGRGICRAGTQQCVIDALGRADFGPCEGEVGPAAGEACDNDRDDDCDGETDEGCTCDGPVACYTGPSGTRGRGACRAGAYRCLTDAAGRRRIDTSACVGEVLPRAPGACTVNTCPNSDVNCDGLPDCSIECRRTDWQVSRTRAPVCYGTTYAECGHRNEFTFAPPVPPADDLSWEPTLDRQINFGTSPGSADRRSRLRDGACACRAGGDFTFFQTTLVLAESPTRPGFADARAFSIDVARFNNAVRATLFNRRFTTGVDLDAFDVASSACDSAPLGPMSSRVDPGVLADLFAPGANRLVLTLLDDCAGERELTGVELHIDGRVLDPCAPDPASCVE